MSKSINSFLGANTPDGFVNFFDELYNPYENSNMYIIKGGPGTGKSSFMKKLAKKAQDLDLDTELVYCGSDTASLDGLFIPRLNFAIADGTSPHVIEPSFPGAVENILNLGEFWDGDLLKENADFIRALTLENSIYHRRSAKFLAAAGALGDDISRIVSDHVNLEKVESFVTRFISREVPRKSSGSLGKKKKRFLSSIGPSGIVCFSDTINTLATKIVGIDDEYSVVSGALLEQIGERAIKNGYDVIFCHNPLKPKNHLEHIIIPELSLCVSAMDSMFDFGLEYERIVHVSRFLDMEKIKENKQKLSFCKKTISELVSESISLLTKAKSIHDDLEDYYINAMDFTALDDFCEEFAAEIFE